MTSDKQHLVLDVSWCVRSTMAILRHLFGDMTQQWSGGGGSEHSCDGSGSGSGDNDHHHHEQHEKEEQIRKCLDWNGDNAQTQNQNHHHHVYHGKCPNGPQHQQHRQHQHQQQKRRQWTGYSSRGKSQHVTLSSSSSATITSSSFGGGGGGRDKNSRRFDNFSSSTNNSWSRRWLMGIGGGGGEEQQWSDNWTVNSNGGGGGRHQQKNQLDTMSTTSSSSNGSSSHHHHHGHRSRSLYLIVMIVSIASYCNSFHGDFVHDDLSAIKTNGDVTGENPLWDMFLNDFWGNSMRSTTSHKSYRPFTILSFRMNKVVHDLEPMGFHILNVALHAAVTAVFVKMCLEVAGTSRTSALLAGLHFATHPIHTEAVTGVVGRADLLAALFVLVSFLCYCRYLKEVEKTRLLVTSVLLAFGGMLSKEHGITVLGINLIWDVYLNRSLIVNSILRRKLNNARMHHLFRRLFIIGLGGLAFVTFRIVMLHGSLPQFSDQDNPASFASCRITRLRTFAYLPVFNFWLLLAPISLNYDWQMGSIPLVDKWTDLRNLPSLLFYTALIATTIYLFFKGKTRKDLVVAWAFLIIPFIPASNLLFRVGFVVAERVLYIPSLGFSLLVGVGAERIMIMQKFCTRRLNLVRASLFLLLTLFTYKTWLRNEDWRTRESLFTSGLRLLPHNAKMHYNYANLQKDLGHTDHAIHHYRLALQLWPHHASAHNNLGTLLNDTAEAEDHFQQALKINPIHSRAYFNLSLLRYQQGKTKTAIRLMERSLELEPENTDALTNLATMYADLGQFERTKEIHLKILELEPSDADHLNNYAAFLQRMGLYSEALRVYEEALIRDSNHTGALVNTARLMKKLKFNEKAESLYQRALQQNPDDAVVKVNLAQTYVHRRKYNEAESLLLAVMEESNSSMREVLHQLAILYSQHLNRTNDAFRYIEMAVKTCSQSDVTCAPLYALNGDLYKDIEDLDSAILSYKQAVETLMRAKKCCLQQKYSVSSSIVTHVHLNLGAIYHVKGRFKEAWKHYNAAWAQDPKNKVLLKNMEKLKKAELQHKSSSSTCHQKDNLTKSIV